MKKIIRSILFRDGYIDRNLEWCFNHDRDMFYIKLLNDDIKQGELESITDISIQNEIKSFLNSTR